MPHRFPVTSSAATLLLASLFALQSVALGGAPSAQAVPAGPGVDLNTADAATLARELQGIGESRALAIVEHRRRHGPFRSVDELALVRGIGPKTVERNRARLRIGGGGGVSVMPSAGGGSRSATRSPSRRSQEGPIIIEGLPREGG
jgi:competence protein ComEA